MSWGQDADPVTGIVLAFVLSGVSGFIAGSIVAGAILCG